MGEPTILAEAYPPLSWQQTVVRGVDQHNVAVTGLSDYYPVGFFIFGAARQTLGGLLGEIWGERMHVARLWVSRALRGKGCGAALMARAHRYAIEKSCTHAFLRTSSYEARPLYEKLGYSVYAELRNHPVAPHGRYFMSCSLQTRSEPLEPNEDLAIVTDPYPSKAVEDVVATGIASHAHAAIGLPEAEASPYNFFLRNDKGEIVGGVLGNLWGDWMYVKFVWIDRSLRGRGHASRLMMAAERYAFECSCRNAFLSTFSFQARPLYERLGYQVFGEQTDYPKGHSLYHLSKRLGGPA
jgi:ribosomal protein S18 acetylase RimI-like enzyme